MACLYSRFSCLSYLVMCLMTPSVMAQDSAVVFPRSTAIEPGSADYILKVTVGLAIVVALIFLLAWLVKRMGSFHLSGNDQFKVLASLVVGQKERLMLVEIAGEQILIGVAPGQVVKVHDVANKIIIEEKQNNAAELFSKKLKQALKNRGTK